MRLNSHFIGVMTLILIASQSFAQGLSVEHEGIRKSEFAMITTALEKKTTLSQKELREKAQKAVEVKEFDRAAEFYERLLDNESKWSTDVIDYVEVLKIQGKYEKAKNWMDIYSQLSPNDGRSKAHMENPDYFMELLVDDNRFTVKKLAINSAQKDFGATYYGEQIVFSSSRLRLTKKGKKSPDTSLDMYVSVGTADEGFKDAVPFFEELNSKYNEGPAAFDREGEFMAVTRNDYNTSNRNEVRRLRLYHSTKNSDGWNNAMEFPWNSEEYSVAHATLSADGTQLYFASDMPGGQGGVDLYKASKHMDGTWSDPINLGVPVNTEGDELFPFIHEKGVLAFSSNGHQGIGGLDNFYVWLKGEKEGQVVNCGKPLNSNRDDFGMIFDLDMKEGYFSSDRDGGLGDDDIYGFNMIPLTESNEKKELVLDEPGKLPDLENKELGTASITSGHNSTLTPDPADNSGKTTLSSNTNATSLNSTESKKGAHTNTSSINDQQNNSTGSSTSIPSVSKSNSVVNSTSSTSRGQVADRVASENSNSTEQRTPPSPENIMNNTSTTMTSTSNGSTSSNFSDQAGTSHNSSAGHVAKTTNTDPTGSAGSSISALASKGKSAGFWSTGMSPTLLGADPYSITLLPGDDLGVLGVEAIYYDIDSFMVGTQQQRELKKIIHLIDNYPNIKVEIQSFTDCRATGDYNRRLSKKRADWALTWLQQRVSDPTRIQSRSMGEARLVNDCPCGFTDLDNEICSEEEHRMNRRTEFKVVKL